MKDTPKNAEKVLRAKRFRANGRGAYPGDISLWIRVIAVLAMLVVLYLHGYWSA